MLHPREKDLEPARPLAIQTSRGDANSGAPGAERGILSVNLVYIKQSDGAEAGSLTVPEHRSTVGRYAA
jgi:hypothetical protein